MPSKSPINSDSGHATRWFVIANGSTGRAYVKRPAESGYDPVRDWDEPDARAKDSELGEDRPGRAFASAGSSARSAMEHDGKDDSPKEHAKRNLARRIGADLTQALRARAVATVVLIAPAAVANAIRTHIPHDLVVALAGEEHADITHLPTADIFARMDGFRHGK